MHFSLAQVISLVIGTVLPLLAGLVVRIDAHPRVRSIVLLVLAGVTSFLTELGSALNAHQAFNIGAALLSVLVTFLAGVAVNFGLWEPTGVATMAKGLGGFIGGSKTPAAAAAGLAAVPTPPTEPATPPSGPAGAPKPIPPA